LQLLDGGVSNECDHRRHSRQERRAQQPLSFGHIQLLHHLGIHVLARGGQRATAKLGKGISNQRAHGVERDVLLRLAAGGRVQYAVEILVGAASELGQVLAPVAHEEKKLGEEGGIVDAVLLILLDVATRLETLGQRGDEGELLDDAGIEHVEHVDGEMRGDEECEEEAPGVALRRSGLLDVPHALSVQPQQHLVRAVLSGPHPDALRLRHRGVTELEPADLVVTQHAVQNEALACNQHRKQQPSSRFSPGATGVVFTSARVSSSYPLCTSGRRVPLCLDTSFPVLSKLN
jgi:hypothetical protein